MHHACMSRWESVWFNTNFVLLPEDWKPGTGCYSLNNQVSIANPAAQAAMAGFNAITDTFDEVDYFSYNAVTSPRFKVKKANDPDYPTYHQAMTRPDAHEWQAAMDDEIKVLVGMNTWTIVPRSEATRLGKQVIKSTWAFRQKRDPQNNPTKKKARFCVRGDLK